MVESNNNQSSDKEQMKQVIAYLNSKEAQGAALDIILAYSTTKQNRELFQDTDVCKALLRLLPEGNQVKVTECLINFSLDNEFSKKLIEYNVGVRILDYLKSNIKVDLKSPAKTRASYNLEKNTFEIQVNSEEGGNQKVKKEDEEHITIEQLIMILTNISQTEEGQKHIVGEGKLEGAMIENLFGMFSYFTKNPVFDFISNILANVAGLKNGRIYMLKNNFHVRLLQELKKQEINEHRQRFIVECVRNLCFEYETFETEFINIKIVEELLQILVNTYNLKEITLQELSYLLPCQSQKESIDKQIIKSLLDSLILLGNSDNLMRRMKDLQMLKLMNLLDNLQDEDIELKLQVLKNQLIADINEEQDKEENQEEQKESEENNQQ